MKCNKCGETCRENQAFCFRCGAPIQVVPDFNLIEAELADSVGQLLEEESRGEEVTQPKEDTLVRQKNSSGLQSKEVNQTKQMSMQDISQSDDNREQDRKKEKKLFAIKVGILSVVVTVIVVLCIVLLMNISRSESKDTFTSKYNQGYELYSKGSYEASIQEFQKARKLVESREDNIKVDKSLLAVFDKVQGYDQDEIEILKELITLEPKEASYYEDLAKLYEKNEMVEELDAFINSVTDASIVARLSEYSVPLPQFSIQEGTYEGALSIKLTTSGDYKIYYTIDGSNPTTDSTLYTSEIRLTDQGTYTIKAFSHSDKGVSSKTVLKNYEIKLTAPKAPVITPAGGTYNEATTIQIQVPPNMKCYYVYGDTGVVPTTADTEYTDEIEMLRGKHIISAIIVDENGTVSEVTQNAYLLDIPRAVEYSGALAFLENYLISKNIVSKAEDGTLLKAGVVKTKFSYNSIAVIANNEYFIVNFETLEMRENAEVVTATEYYGVDTVTGSVVKLQPDPEHAGLYILTE